MSGRSLGARLRDLFGAPSRDFFEELEDILIEGDIGPANAAQIIETARSEIRGREARDRDRFFELLKAQLGTRIRVEPLEPAAGTVNLILVLGVNGVGKTTTIAKLAHHYVEQGSKRVVLAAADTFRAAAIDQLLLWGNRLSLPVVRQDPGSDPGAVVFDALSSAEAAGADLVIADTAGRMHNKAHLVKELGKIDKIASRRLQPQAYRKVLVIDATTGQNALRQAQVFHEAVGVDAVIVAKYDSTAKGGIVVAIARELGIPFAFLGTGEKPDDLQRFTTQDYLNRLLEVQ